MVRQNKLNQEHLFPFVGNLFFTDIQYGLGATQLVSLQQMHTLHQLKRQGYRIEGLLRRQWNRSLIAGEKGVVSATQHLVERQAASGQILERYRLSSGTRLQSTTRVHFSPRGVVTPKTLVLQKGAARCAVIVSLYGRTRQRCWIH